jgi:hypothetical protein
MSRRGRVIPFPGLPPASARPPLRLLRADDRAGLVEVYRGSHAEAVVVRSLLESEGIPTLVRSRVAHSVYPFSVGAQGEVAILVPGGEAQRSRSLLQD